MEEAIYKIASSVSTPLALAGITVALFSRIILAIIGGNVLSRADAGESASILKRIVTLFFVLSIVVAVLGVVGWLYTKAVGERRRTTALESFSHLVTTMRTETDRLMIEYPDDYKKLLAEGRTPDEAKQRIAGEFRHRIDTTVAGDKLGSQMRAGFPEYPWGFFFRKARTTSANFLMLFTTTPSIRQPQSAIRS